MSRGIYSDDEVLESLRGEESGASEESKKRVFQRLAATIGASLEIRDVDEPSVPASPSASPASPRMSLATVGRPWALALAFAAGGGTGAAVYATLARSPVPQVVDVNRAPEVALVASERAAVAPAPSEALIERSDGPPTGRNLHESRTPAGPAKGGVADLAAQQALLDAARASFGRGDNAAALRTIAVHERRHPDSILREEREALAIKALVASARYTDAKVRGARFVERYPRSLLLPAVMDALQSIP